MGRKFNYFNATSEMVIRYHEASLAMAAVEGDEIMEIFSVFVIIIILCILLVWCTQPSPWDRIERLNEGLGITRHTAYIDKRGYLRWKETNRLCHRDIAFKAGLRHRYLPFGHCDVHHRDHNKMNNQPDNLEVVSREEHQHYHGGH